MHGCCSTRASSGASVTPTLQGLEACNLGLILQVDVDLLLPGCPYEPLTQPGMGTCNAFGSRSQPLLTPCSSGDGSKSSSSGQLGLCCEGSLQQLAGILIDDPAAISISLPCLPLTSNPAPLSSSARAAECVQQGSCAGSGYNLTASYINPATGHPWRVEVRGCLLHRSRLMQLLPLSISTAGMAVSTRPHDWPAPPALSEMRRIGTMVPISSSALKP